jgi:hypothetical protein
MPLILRVPRTEIHHVSDPLGAKVLEQSLKKKLARRNCAIAGIVPGCPGEKGAPVEKTVPESYWLFTIIEYPRTKPVLSRIKVHSLSCLLIGDKPNIQTPMIRLSRNDISVVHQLRDVSRMTKASNRDVSAKNRVQAFRIEPPVVACFG